MSLSSVGRGLSLLIDDASYLFYNSLTFSIIMSTSKFKQISVKIPNTKSEHEISLVKRANSMVESNKSYSESNI